MGTSHVAPILTRRCHSHSQYDAPVSLTPIVVSLTPIRLGAKAGKFAVVVEDTTSKTINAVVHFDDVGKGAQVKSDVTLNRLKVDDARTLDDKEKAEMTEAVHGWLLECVAHSPSRC